MNTNPLQNIKATVRQYLSSGRHTEARKLLEQTDISTDAEIWLLRGVTNGLSGNSNEARLCFEKTIALSPNWAEAYFNLGNALIGQGEFHAAANAFAAAVKNQPNYTQAVTAFRWADRRRWGKQRIAVEIKDGIRVVCPRALQCATTYVLLEQEDWFEPEIHFLRQMTQPGMNAIDIGANHGIYSLVLAKAAGASGHVWAFEPATEPADCLAESIILNNFSNITLVRRALSNQEGEGMLLIDDSPELNRLVAAKTAATDQLETVRLSTLDACADEFGWHNIDFIKLDAEGAETAIIEGGRKFLSAASPLIMYEVQHKSVLNLKLVDQFRELGFESYRYVPGIDALVPWCEKKSGQSTQLNLFCARPDRAAQLAQRGLLIRSEELQREFPITEGAWNTLCAHPLSNQQKKLISQKGISDAIPHNPALADYDCALNFYALACGTQHSLADRYLALEQAFIYAEHAQQTEWHAEFAALTARIGLALDHRSESLKSLYALLSFLRKNAFTSSLPYLPADAGFDTIPVDLYASVHDWFMCAALETWERYRAWSSFWAGTDEFNALSWLNTATQHQSAEMNRRRKLHAYSRGGIKPAAEPSQTEAAALRNDAIWTELALTYTVNQPCHPDK